MPTKTSSKKKSRSSASKTSTKQPELVIDVQKMMAQQEIMLKNKEILGMAAVIMGGVIASRTQHQLQNLNIEEMAAFSMLCAKRLDAISGESAANLQKIVTLKGVIKK